MDNLILYEHPLNETIRVCLRLEALFAQTEHWLNQSDYWNIRATITSIIDINVILDRPDFKSKLTKQLIDQKENLSQHLNTKLVDQTKLRQVLEQLDNSITYLQNITGKLNQALEQEEFLNSIRLRLNHAGGGQNFDLPIYHFWLHQPETQCQRDLHKWVDYFKPILQIIKLLLMLTRQSGNFITLTASHGYYEKTLDTAIDFQLLRIQTKINAKAFPDISVGRHRLSIHFFCLNIIERPIQFREDIQFKLAFCV